MEIESKGEMYKETHKKNVQGEWIQNMWYKNRVCHSALVALEVLEGYSLLTSEAKGISK